MLRPRLVTVCLTAAALSLAGCAADLSDPSERSAASVEGVYDAEAVHEVTVELDPADFATMLATYQASEEKEWITASVTIDEEIFERVGLRLKGNSSLRQLSGDSSATELPWLIRLDKFVPGQTLEGYSEFVIRSNTSQTSLNEAVALDLLAAAGLASEKAVATQFAVNGEPARLRLMVQHLDDTWEGENFDSAGALYKAESGGDYSYRGTDPESYVEVFEQETGEVDLTPLIEFLDFVNNATDEDFATELADHLDIDAFATYLAFEDLVGNFDDIDGPGNNSYLRFNSESGQFTVVGWDHNLTFGIGPGGGGVGPGSAGRPDREKAPPPATDASRHDRPTPGGRENPLVTRFLANAEFKTAVDQASERLTESLIAGGIAEEVVADWVAVLTDQATDVVEREVIESEAAQIEDFLGST